MTDRNDVTSDEVVGLLTPEITSMSRELEAMRRAHEVQEATIENLKASLQQVATENCKAYDSLMAAYDLLREKDAALDKMGRDLINSRRNTDVSNTRVRMLSTELSAIADHLRPSMANTPQETVDRMGALDLVHAVITSIEVQMPRPAPYIPEHEVENLVQIRKAERDERMNAHCLAMTPMTLVGDNDGEGAV